MFEECSTSQKILKRIVAEWVQVNELAFTFDWIFEFELFIYLLSAAERAVEWKNSRYVN